MTQDCLALAATRRWAAVGLSLAGTLLLGVFAVLFTLPERSSGRIAPSWAHDVEPFRTILQWIEPRPAVMGVMCPPAPIPGDPGGGGGQPGPDER